MTAPLGFRRSTRKKLLRCEHPDVDAWQDPTQPANIVECAACGVRISVPHRGLPVSLAYFRSLLPERIAPLPQRTLYAWREGLHIAPDVPVVGKWTGPQ